MDERKYVIKRVDRPSLILSGVEIGCNDITQTLQTTKWTTSKSEAIHFEKEEAEATIEFITNVIDWDLGDQLIAINPWP